MKKLKKKFCIHGHEIAKVGRNKGGACNGCDKPYKQKWFKEHYVPHPMIPTSICVNGHDKDIVGRAKNGRCKICTKICATNRRRQKGIRLRRKFCPKWHDKDVVGRNKQGACVECRRLSSKEQNKKTKMHRKEINDYIANKMLTDVNFKIACKLRSRLQASIRNSYKKGSAIKDLGCSIEFFKKYIQEKFYGGMTWGNWGKIWQLDHIVSLKFFDLTNRKQFLKAVNYKNMQPLTILDHKKKTAREMGLQVLKKSDIIKKWKKK